MTVGKMQSRRTVWGDQLASESSVSVAVFSLPSRMNVTVTESPGRKDRTVAMSDSLPVITAVVDLGDHVACGQAGALGG